MMKDYGSLPYAPLPPPSGGAACPAGSSRWDFRQGGVIREDACWRGEIHLEGDLLIPPGRTLTLLPGTTLRFAKKQGADLLVRRISGERNPATAPGRSYLVVEGTLLSAGEPGSGRIHLLSDSAAGWGGILIAGRGRANVRGTLFEGALQALQCLNFSRLKMWNSILRGSGGESVGIFCCGFGRAAVRRSDLSGHGIAAEATDDARLSLRSCDIGDGGTGILGSLTASIDLEDNRIRCQSRTAVFLSGAARVRLCGGTISRNGSGLYAGGGSRVEAERLRIEASEREGVRLVEEGRVEAADCVVEGTAGAGVRLSGGSRLCWRGGTLEANGDGIVIDGNGAARLQDCEVRRNRNCGISAKGGRLAVEKCRIHGNGKGIAPDRRAGVVCLSCDLEENREAGIACGGESRLSMKGGRIAGSACGLQAADRSQVRMEGVRLAENERQGIWLRGESRLGASACTIVGTAGAAICVDGNGELHLRNGAVEENGEGVVLEGEGERVVAGCRIAKNRNSGVNAKNGGTTIRESWIENNAVGIACEGSARVRCSSNRIKGNREAGIKRRSEVPAEKNGEERDDGSLGRLEMAGDRLENNGEGIILEGGGRCLLRRCRITGSRGRGVNLRGGELVAEKCRIDGNKQGIACDGRARLVCLESDLAENGESGLGCHGESRVRIRGVQIAGGANGLYAGGCSEVEAERMHVKGSGTQGIRLEGESRIRAEACVIAGSKGPGVFVGGRGGLSLRSGKVAKNGDGVVLAGEGNSAIEKCDLRGNRDCGINAKNGTLRTLGNLVRGNRIGLRLTGRARAHLAGDGILENEEIGLAVGGESDVRADALDIRSNRSIAVESREGALLQMTDSRVEGSRDGMKLFGGRVSAAGTAFRGHKFTAVNVFGGRHRLADCTFRKNSVGAASFSDSRLELERCDFNDHRESAVNTFEDSLSRLSSCRLQGKGSRLVIHDRSGAEFE